MNAETPPAIGDDERRMQVRAYNYWVSLLRGRAFPAIEDVEPGSIGEFGPNSVLLDFSAGIEHPAIIFLGGALREECGLVHEVSQLSEVPARSLLSRLTDHYLQIIANRVPVGFEAEFTNQRGRQIMYRGILMPFSSNGDAIDFIYGVINWKEGVDTQTEAALTVEVDEALRSTPRPAPAVPVWEDSPNSRSTQRSTAPHAVPVGYGAIAEPAFAGSLEEIGFGDPDEPNDGPAGAGGDAGMAFGEDDGLPAFDADEDGLAELLAAAREGADSLRDADGRGRAVLNRALGLAYDFALLTEARPEEFAELLEDAGMTVQARAPMAPIIKLIFGTSYDKLRLAEFAAVLGHGRRHDVELGGLCAYIERHPGGLKGVVQTARAERRAAAPPRPDPSAKARAALRAMPARAVIDIAAGDEEFLLLVARRIDADSVAVIAPVARDEGLLRRVLRFVTR